MGSNHRALRSVVLYSTLGRISHERSNNMLINVVEVTDFYVYFDGASHEWWAGHKSRLR